MYQLCQLFFGKIDFICIPYTDEKNLLKKKDISVPQKFKWLPFKHMLHSGPGSGGNVVIAHKVWKKLA